MALEPLGLVVGEARNIEISFTANRPPQVGEYIIVEYPKTRCYEDMECNYVLGIVEASLIGNPMMNNLSVKPDHVEKALQFGADRHIYMVGQARLLSWVEPLAKRKVLYAPKHPPMPGAKVYRADDETLQEVFSCRKENRCIPIGRLVNHPNVKVNIDVNAIMSRHLAILAVTGAGKSNTVGVLLDRIANDLNGTALVIDMHNEYGNIAGPKTKKLAPRLNPASLSVWEYYALLGLDEKASKQRMYLARAYDEVTKDKDYPKHPEKFIPKLREVLERYAANKTYAGDKRSIIDVINKLDDLMRRYGDTVLSPEAPINIESYVEPGMINVLQLGSVDEDVADAVTYHYLNSLLTRRKEYVTSKGGSGYPVPILIVIEEAHILIPRDRRTLTKSVAARIAREGRKFGVGLTLVSQRPKNIDEDALSQTNNKIILKLVSPEDLRYVQRASETLSDELLDMLPALNVGEAVLLGMMIPVPAIVKIDKHERKTEGGDIDAVGEWSKYAGEDVKESRNELDGYDDFIMT